MKKLCFLLLSVWFSGISSAQTAHIPGEVMVMLEPQAKVETFVRQLNALYPGSAFAVSREVTRDWNIWLLGYDTRFMADESALLSVTRHPMVSLAQFNYPVELRVVPDDPSFGQQWALDNTGQNGGMPDADIDAPEAWNTTTGGVTADGDTIVVAVIDGGFDPAHPDLVPNYWVNRAEIPGNGIDDDGNGYIDDVDGWNVYDNNGTLPVANHGTHVAGIVGARGNNTLGVSGVNWNVKLMRVAGSSGNSATVVSAYAYVAKQRKLYNETGGAQGAFVVSANSSFGVNFGQAANFPVWCAFYDTLGTLGILSVGSGPNSNVDIDIQGDIPTTCPSSFLVAVTNTTRMDTKNGGSGYGVVNIDLGAPGTDIYSTVLGGNYQSLTGTSMAAPHVSGAIGLYYAAACGNFLSTYKSNLSGGAMLMRGFLLSGVDSTTAMANTTAAKGRLNLRKGISRIQAGCNDVPVVPPAAAFAASAHDICVGGQVSYTDQSTEQPLSWYWSFPGGTPASSTLQNPQVAYAAAGTYAATLTAYNAGGFGSVTQQVPVTVHAMPPAPVVTENAGILQSNYATGNQWYGMAGSIAGATSQTFTPQGNDFYYVIYTDPFGCVSTQSAGYLVNASVHTWEVAGLNIYPNPVGHAFTVSWNAAQTKINGIRLYDAVGRVVYTAAAPASGTLTIPSGDWAAGSYVLELATDRGTVRKPLIK